MSAPDRRFVLSGLALGPLVFAGGVISPAVAQPAPLGWTPRALTPAQARALDAVAEQIMPQTDTPGARAAGVPAFIDRALVDFHTPADRRRIVEALDRLNAEAMAEHGAEFAALSAERQAAHLQRWDARADPAFGPLRDNVTIAFFTSEPGVTQTLRYDPLPGDYRACVPFSEIGRAWATS